MPKSNYHTLIQEKLKQRFPADGSMVLRPCLGGIKQCSFTEELQELYILNLLTNRIGTPILPEPFGHARAISSDPTGLDNLMIFQKTG